MKQEHIPLLCCLECRAPLALVEQPAPVMAGAEIFEGALECQACRARYPIVRGVGVFFPTALLPDYLTPEERRAALAYGVEVPPSQNEGVDDLEKRQIATARNWSYQWNVAERYGRHDLDGDLWFGEEAFFLFIPLPKERIRDKVAVVWCGARGRETYHLHKCQPKLVVVVEIGDEIYGIRDQLDPGAEVLLLRADMTKSPLRPGVADISICDHALQHVSDHQKGYANLVAALRPGGLAAVNVYSHENNWVMTGVVEPLKPWLHRLPLRALHYLSYIPGTVLYALLRWLYAPLNRLLPPSQAARLPLNSNMVYWAEKKKTLRLVSNTIFDLVHAPISYHFRQEEMEALARTNGVRVVYLKNINQTTWTMVGLKQ